MAGNLSMMEHSKLTRLREQWEICFARFIPYPTLPSSSSSSSDLLPLPPRLRNHSPRGNWISSSSSVAFLRLSLSHLLLTVSFNASLFEEHHITKLHFSWPHVSCVSGFPARGIRTVLVSYRDSLGEAREGSNLPPITLFSSLTNSITLYLLSSFFVRLWIPICAINFNFN